MNTMTKRLLGLVLICLVLVGCASGPVYRPAVKPGDFGYRDTQLTSQHFRVSFAGDDNTARETVENFALYRAADVALSHGADRFMLTSQQTSPVTETTDFGPTASVGYGWGYPYWGTGIGYSSNIVSDTRYETVLQILIGPEVPEQGPNVYNAIQIKKNLSADVAAAER